jgi:anti-anti-sigma regulatory factor
VVAAPYTLVRFEGDLEASRYPEFRERFLAVPPDRPVLLDLSGARSADSTFLSEMLLFKRRHRAPVAVLIEPGGWVARIFGLANLDARLDVHLDRAAAIAVLTKSAAGSDGEALHERLLAANGGHGELDLRPGAEDS